MKILLIALALSSTLLFCVNAVPQVVGPNRIGPPMTYVAFDAYGDRMKTLTFNTIGEAQSQWLADFSTAPSTCSYSTEYITPMPGNDGEYEGWNLMGSNCPHTGIYVLSGSTMYVSLYLADPGKNNGHAGCCAIGDPINIATGNEFEEVQDYQSDDLKFVRSYNSDPAAISGHIGAHWTTNYNLTVSQWSTSTSSGTDAIVTRPDGKYYHFSKTNGVWAPDSNVSDVLTELDDAKGSIIGWKYYDSGTLNTESYDANGRLMSIDMRNGRFVNLTYNGGLLVSITDSKGRSLSLSYDSSSRINSLTTPSGGVFIYSYDSSGTLHSVQNPGGATITYLYDESSNVTPDTTGVEVYAADYPYLLTGVIDENNVRYINVTYNGSDHATSSQLGGIADTISVSYGPSAVVYNGQLQSSYSFSETNGKYSISAAGANCLKACSDPWKSQTYDSNGYPATHIDFNGNETDFTYGANGLETQRVEAVNTSLQRSEDTVWDTALREPLSKSLYSGKSLLKMESWAYNARGQVLALCEIDPAGGHKATSYSCGSNSIPPSGVRQRTYSYCDAVDSVQCPIVGLLLKAAGPRTDLSQSTTYSYYMDAAASGCGTPGGACHQPGDLHTITDALGHVSTIVSYDADGRVTREADPNGVNIDLTYTPRGWLHTKSVDGATTTIDYDAVGDVIKVTQPDGVFTSYTYDSARRLISIADALGNHVDYALDAAGNRTAESTYASGSSTPSRSLSRQYNTLGELVQSLDAYSHVTSYAYDQNGNRTDNTDPLGITTHSSYDALNRLVQTIQNYEGSDTATANATTSFAYDSRDNLTQVTDPDSLNTRYTYNGFNDLGQLQSPDTGTSSYTYDAAGNRISRTDARGVVTNYSYDALNRLTAISYPTSALNVQYAYDQGGAMTGCANSYPMGRLTRMTSGTGTTTYCYDSRGNVVSTVQVTAGTTYTTGYTYDAASLLMGMTYPDGTSITYTRDADGRIVTVSSTLNGLTTPVVSSVSYLPFGPATQYIFASGGQALAKIYDANYRPTDITSSALNLHFALDAVGDIVKEGDAAGVPTPNESYRYDPLYRLQQVDDATGTPWQSYTYDKAGDRLTKITTGQSSVDNYSYTSGTHHLIGISGYDTSSRAFDANGNTTALQANGWMYGLGYADTNRLSLVQQNGTSIMTYALNGEGERLRKVPASGAPTDFVYDESGKLLGEYAGSHSQTYIWADNTLVATVDGGSTLDYVYTDQLGTPRAVTNTTSSTPIWTWPWLQNPFGEKPASGSGYMLNLRYPGQYFDAETGLMYNLHRDYESGTGRYIESDPIGLKGGISSYNYAEQGPLAFSDRTGNKAVANGPLPPGFSASTIICNGLGDLIYYRSPVLTPRQVQCFGECDREHEMIHRRDYLLSNPDLCKGQPPNTEVGFEPLIGNYNPDRAQSEVNGLTAEIACLEQKIEAEEAKQCPTCLQLDQTELAKSKDLLARYKYYLQKLP